MIFVTKLSFYKKGVTTGSRNSSVINSRGFFKAFALQMKLFYLHLVKTELTWQKKQKKPPRKS
jgi:hypothetical protein